MKNGDIIFIGRSDRQVKINGKRIELSGINAMLRSLDGIHGSAVKVDSTGKKILAYYVAYEELGEKKLQQELKKHLPDYMIPKSIIRLEALPLTANGKVDMKKLPEERINNEPGTVMHTDKEKESGVNEDIIMFIRNIFDDQNVALNDNFFMLGGNSIMLIQLINYINEKYGVMLNVADMFAYETIGEIATEISANI